MPRIGSTLLAGLAYAGIAVWYSWPLATQIASALPSPRLPGLAALARIDVDLVVWILAWGAHALRRQPFDLFGANIFYPAPDTLAASENLLGLQPIAAPIFWSSGNPVLTYNLTILAIVWLGAMCSFAAVRAWTGSAAAGFLAGCAFGLAPPIVGDWVRLHWTAVALFPLITLLVWRAAERPRPSILAALVLATALQIAAGVYVAFELAVWLLALVPAIVLGSRRRGEGGLAPLVGLAAGALLAAPLAVPYLRLRRLGGFPDLATSLQIVAATSPSPAALLASIPRDLSWPVAALAALALVGRRRPSRDVRWGIAAAGALGFVLACGTSLPGVYRAAMAVIPGFTTIRGPSRFFVLTILAGALLAGIGAADVAARLRARGPRLRLRAEAAIAAAAIALLSWRAPPPLPLAKVPGPGGWDVYRWLAEHGDGGPLLELPVLLSPLDPGPLLATGRAMVGSTLHWLPLLNGYSGHPPPSARLIATLAERLPDAQAFAGLCSLVGLRWIAVDRSALPARGAEWDEGVARLPLRPTARFGVTALYEVTEPCGAKESLLRAELRGERRDRTLGDVPLAPLGPAALHGRVEARVEPRMASGIQYSLDVVVTNDGPAPWPGETSHSDGRIAVQTRWRIAGEKEPRYNDAAVPLARDLAPGESLRLTIGAFTPRPGRHEIEVGLLQEGRGWFDDLDGSASMRLPIETAPLQSTSSAKSSP
jgi:hypothetical protein